VNPLVQPFAAVATKGYVELTFCEVIAREPDVAGRKFGFPEVFGPPRTVCRTLGVVRTQSGVEIAAQTAGPEFKVKRP